MQNSRGVYFEDCIYYYWFEYLKLSRNYRKACQNNGKGMEDLYTNFGNVFDIHFMDWWEEADEHGHTRGARLFGDTKITKMESFITPEQALELRPEIDRGKYKLLAVPTNATKKELSRGFTLLLRDLAVDENRRISTAKYQICNFRVTPKTLKKSLDAWNYNETGKYTGALIGALISDKNNHDDIEERKKHKEMIKRMKARMGTRSRMGSSFDTDDKYASFSVSAIRALKRIEPNIKAAENGFFPVSDMNEFNRIMKQRKKAK